MRPLWNNRPTCVCPCVADMRRMIRCWAWATTPPFRVAKIGCCKDAHAQVQLWPYPCASCTRRRASIPEAATLHCDTSPLITWCGLGLNF